MYVYEQLKPSRYGWEKVKYLYSLIVNPVKSSNDFLSAVASAVTSNIFTMHTLVVMEHKKTRYM